MKKIFLFLLFTASLHAETFGYGDLQAMGGFPMAGLGLRTQKGSHALDFSANACIWPSPTLLHVKALYMFYPFDGGTYLGGGVGFTSSDFDDLIGSFESALGYQWEAESHYFVFVEGTVMYPFERFKEQGALRICPGVTFGLGF